MMEKCFFGGKINRHMSRVFFFFFLKPSGFFKTQFSKYIRSFYPQQTPFHLTRVLRLSERQNQITFLDFVEKLRILFCRKCSVAYLSKDIYWEGRKKKDQINWFQHEIRFAYSFFFCIPFVDALVSTFPFLCREPCSRFMNLQRPDQKIKNNLHHNNNNARNTAN